MDEREELAQRFEEHRTHLRAVAYRMLGSLAEADEAVQDGWLRVSRAGAAGVENLGGWFTTVVARVCLNRLRMRKARPEVTAARMPEPIVTRDRGRLDPEHEVLLADSVGLALQVVLDALTPAERLAFVLHDMFDVPFDDIAVMMGRSSEATRQLASRARRRVRGAAVPTPDRDLGRQRRVVDAFFAAARRGDFDALVALLDPDVVLRSDGGERHPTLTLVSCGATEVAGRALQGTLPHALLLPVLVNGSAGAVVLVKGKPFAVMGFVVAGGKIVELDIVLDPDRLARLDPAALAN